MNDTDIQEQVICLNYQDYTDRQLDKIKVELENIIKYYDPESIIKVEIRDYKDINTFKEFNQFIKVNPLSWNGKEFIKFDNEVLSVEEVEDMYNVRLKPFL